MTPVPDEAPPGGERGASRPRLPVHRPFPPDRCRRFEHGEESIILPGLLATADRLHSAGLHLFRQLRDEETWTGLSAPRHAALAAIVHGGPFSVGWLARMEEVSPPTASALVRGLESDGFVTRRTCPTDRRITLVEATAEGRRTLEETRAWRVERMRARLGELRTRDKLVLRRAAELLEELVLPPRHPMRLRPPPRCSESVR